MEIIKIQNLKFRYSGVLADVLNNISLSVEEGEFVTLLGKSGSGKSTLLRCLKPSVTPFGTMEGNIFYKNKLMKNTDDRKIGFVMQNPDNQMVTDKVFREIAFGLESLGVKNDEICRRSAEIATFFGLSDVFYEKISNLSGGKRQLLSLASVMVMNPDVLILDEPTAQLDPTAAEKFINALLKLNREMGTTVILSEHRTENIISVSDKIVLMENGEIKACDAPNRICREMSENSFFHSLPVAAKLYYSTGNKGIAPLNVKEGIKWLKKEGKKTFERPAPEGCNDTIISGENLTFGYDREIIKNLSLKVGKGEIYALTGGNGSGKTTLLSLLCGIHKPQKGKVVCRGKIAMLPQNPQLVFTEKTVEEELGAQEKDKVPKNLLKRHPFDLSGGEMQKVALIKVLKSKPQILLLDEPTKGIDPWSRQELVKTLKDLKCRGMTIIIVSHDMEFCAEVADRCGMLSFGEIAFEKPAGEFFAAQSYYTTDAVRISKNIISNAITVKDLIKACGGKEPEFEEKPTHKTAEKNTLIKEKTLTFKGIKPALIATLLAIVTIILGNIFFRGRKYYLISFLIIAEALVSFFVLFERRKPKTGELVVLSVLTAIGVMGRTAFYMLPQFKPAAAMVIISGAAFGGEAGFIVGAMTAFASNFLIGQGPWTPWQMLAFGSVGLISGLVFGSGLIKKSRLKLSILGGFITVIVYGGIMNPASVLMYQSKPTAEMLFTAYGLGLPFDIIHGVSTVIFMWIAAPVILEKLERIKTKFGII